MKSGENSFINIQHLFPLHAKIDVYTLQYRQNPPLINLPISYYMYVEWGHVTPLLDAMIVEAKFILAKYFNMCPPSENI